MKATYSALMSSKYFNPAFNSAIFDGPVRIYFAQFHESMALKIYFSLQQKFPTELQAAKDIYRQVGKNVLVMLYPTKDSFDMAFDSASSAGEGQLLSRGDLHGDTVIGINGPFEDDKLVLVLDQIVEALSEWTTYDSHKNGPSLVAQPF